MTVTFLTVSSS